MADTDVSKMKVADLKRELKNRGLSTVGNKTELVERLQAHLIEGDTILEDSAISEEMLDEDVLNDDDELDDDTDSKSLLDSNEDAILKSPDSETKSISLKGSPQAEPVNHRKITLKRNLSTITALSSIETEPVESQVKKIKINAPDTENGTEENADPIDEQNENSDKKVIKLTELTAKDRLELRVKRFGAPVTADIKKLARAERFGIKDDDKGASITSTAVPASADLLKKRAERFGVSVSTEMITIENKEKLLKRQERFGAGADKTATAKIPDSTESGAYAEKAKLRLERFKQIVK